MKKTRKVREINAETLDKDEYFVGSVEAESDDLIKADKVGEKRQENVQEYAIGEISTISDWSISLSVNENDVIFKLDTGAQVKILPKSEFSKLVQKPKLNESKVQLAAYNKTIIPVLGKCILRALHKNKVIPLIFTVAKTDSMAILGLDTCEKLNLVKRMMLVNNETSDIMEELSDCIGEIGTLPKIHHIHVDPEVMPVVHPPRRVPVTLHDKLKVELDRMERLKVTERVFEPTEWVSSLVVVQKPNGKLRLCLEPKDLKKLSRDITITFLMPRISFLV